MKIIHHEKISTESLPPEAIASTYISYIEIQDINTHAKNLFEVISDTSWINNLNPIAKKSYEETANKTIEKLSKIFKEVKNTVTKEFGEFLVSMSSGHCLKIKENHVVLPLSELWKEKLSNNHGFDFHTVSPSNKIAFGEAKYVSDDNSYNAAAKQVNDFIEDSKDGIDAVHLMHLTTPESINNLLESKRGFIVAFSINSENYKLILDNTLKNEYILNLTKSCDELYIIGVKA